MHKPTSAGTLSKYFHFLSLTDPLAHLRIIAKLGKLHVIQQAASCFDDVFTLLWSLLNLSSQK